MILLRWGKVRIPVSELIIAASRISEVGDSESGVSGKKPRVE